MGVAKSYGWLRCMGRDGDGESWGEEQRREMGFNRTIPHMRGFELP